MSRGMPKQSADGDDPPEEEVPGRSFSYQEEAAVATRLDLTK